MCTLITSKSTDIDENIANQNHATRTRKPKPGILNSLMPSSYSSGTRKEQQLGTGKTASLG